MRWGGAGPVPITCSQGPNAPRSRFAASPASHRRVFFFTISHALVSGSFCGVTDPQNYAESFPKARSVVCHPPVLPLCFYPAAVQHPSLEGSRGKTQLQDEDETCLSQASPQICVCPQALRIPSSLLLLPPFPCFPACLCSPWPCVQALQGRPALTTRFPQAAGAAHSPLTWGCSLWGGRPAGKEQPRTFLAQAVAETNTRCVPAAGSHSCPPWELPKPKHSGCEQRGGDSPPAAAAAGSGWFRLPSVAWPGALTAPGSPR